MSGLVTHGSRSALARARLFLHKASSADAADRVDFEAYLEAAIVFARAALHRLQFKYERHPEWKVWWASLLKEPAAEFFRYERDFILKQAPPRIGQKVFLPAIGPVGAHIPAHSPAKAEEFYFLEDPETPATVTVRRHLDTFERLLLEAEERFAALGI